MIHIDFQSTLTSYRDRVEQALRQAIAKRVTACTVLRDAMQYAVLNGGKRLRPTMFYATAACFTQNVGALDFIAAAIECIHCYSLIHDDLPAMDDDMLRRGKPTCHIAFGEAAAILAGDALQTLAFELLSSPLALSAPIQLKLIHLLSTCAGANGMGAGQSLDMLSEGKQLSEKELTHIHLLKTGALIKASVMMGAIAAGCDDAHTLKTLEQFANQLGLAFQMQDDLLDMIGDVEKTGKNTRQDIHHHKATFATILGVDATRQKIMVLMKSAKNILQSLWNHDDAEFLLAFCEELEVRV